MLQCTVTRDRTEVVTVSGGLVVEAQDLTGRLSERVVEGMPGKWGAALVLQTSSSESSEEVLRTGGVWVPKREGDRGELGGEITAFSLFLLVGRVRVVRTPRGREGVGRGPGARRFPSSGTEAEIKARRRALLSLARVPLVASLRLWVIMSVRARSQILSLTSGIGPPLVIHQALICHKAQWKKRRAIQSCF